jgi:cytoskeleton protein RodZ
VCRALKIDPAPVLALLPQPAGHILEHVSEGINAPFRDRPGRREPKDLTMLASPAVWGPALVVLAAAVVYLMPEAWLTRAPATAAAPPAPAASASVTIIVPPADVVDSAPAVPATPASATPASAPAASAPVRSSAATGPLLVRVKAESWVEVQDARSRLLLSRNVQPGESLSLDGAMPLRVTIGNAAETEIVFRGRALDLAPIARDNVARLELK